MKAISSALPGVMVAGLLAACGTGGAETQTETVVRTVRDPPAMTVPSEPPAGTDTTERPPREPARRPRPETADLDSFSSPSGNIGCVVTPIAARCDIRERDWAPPPPPPGCELDYGQGLEVPAGGAADLVCAGDTALDPQHRVLSYGDEVEVGLLTCASAEDGVTCRDRETGRGFFIARERYELF